MPPFISRRVCLTAIAASGLLPLTATAAGKPALFLIGDSTIRNGRRDNGEEGGQFGWGHMMRYYFDTSRIDVVNDAMGGTSSRSFQTSPGLWPKVRLMIRPGDYVLMAFGHNDSRGSLPGNGEDTQPLPQSPDAPPNPPGAVMHSFGWYMRQYIRQVRAHGATPIVLSLIPRNRWTDGKVRRNDKDYALWAQQAAAQENAQFIPLNAIIADRYDALGEDKVTAEFFPPNEAVHPNWTGASFNAQCVIEGLKALDTPLKSYLLPNPAVPATPDVIPPAVGEPGPSGLAPKTRSPSNFPVS